MAKAYLALGANLAAPEVQLEEAIRRLGDHKDIAVTARSSVIVTKPWGRVDQNDFHNMVVEVETSLEPLPLLDACLAVENEMGRIREERWGPRLIDIDLITYERMTIDTERLKLPHPYAAERDFVLDPLREIAPETAAWLQERQRETSL